MELQASTKSLGPASMMIMQLESCIAGKQDSDLDETFTESEI